MQTFKILNVLYRDQDMVAVNKPAGLLVHRSPIDRHEKNFALQILRDQLGQPVYPVHRLDKPTSGVLLFALNPETARHLSTAFAEHRMQKTYLAVVRGYTAPEGMIDYPLTVLTDKYSPENRSLDASPQSAATGYKCLGKIELPYLVSKYPTSRYSLLVITPQSGRRHQIRRHMRHIFHPIIGDVRYGEGRHNRFFRDHFQSNRLLLAAVELAFNHPATSRRLTITAPLAGCFAAVIQKLQWQEALPPEWLDCVSGSIS